MIKIELKISKTRPNGELLLLSNQSLQKREQRLGAASGSWSSTEFSRSNPKKINRCAQLPSADPAAVLFLPCRADSGLPSN
ncbi:hypothetical protein SLEP1_g25731 [Rubroshorea leprosula]|uniref:Uncharacterized protein n=1 Tax=Rubroshorea leprosula TaxID=152421 RepID=A0AAV5JS44_9ROSI|nr:hypothetical protein SLEP1_g25731 [Rubroshorea leprosula]